MTTKVKKQIEELEKTHRYVSDNLIDAIWTVDVETMKFEYITGSIEKISGFSVDEYLNSSIENRFTPESFQKVKAMVAEEIPRFKRGIITARTVEVELIHKNGTLYWAELRAKLFTEGKSLKIHGVTREISRQKKMNNSKMI